MQVLYGEGLVSHTGPESCVVSRKGAIEALTGGVWAGPLSHENGLSQDADDFPPSEGNIDRDVDDEFLSGPAWSLEPWHVHKLSAREPRDPDLGRLKMLSRSARRTSLRERP